MPLQSFRDLSQFFWVEHRRWTVNFNPAEISPIHRPIKYDVSDRKVCTVPLMPVSKWLSYIPLHLLNFVFPEPQNRNCIVRSSDWKKIKSNFGQTEHLFSHYLIWDMFSVYSKYLNGTTHLTLAESWVYTLWTLPPFTHEPCEDSPDVYIAWTNVYKWDVD